MASYQETPNPIFRATDSNGDPLVGGKLYTYAAGTSTPLATYTDSTGGTPNANPVILDSRGEAPVWRTPGVLYKFILKTSADVQLGSPMDNIGNIGSTPSNFQDQTFTAFTTGGTSTAYTLTPSPEIAANAENIRFSVEFHATNGAAPTLSISGQASLALYFMNNGVKTVVQSGQILSGTRYDVVHDGTNWIVLGLELLATATVAAHATTMNPWVAEKVVASGTAVTFTDIADAPYIGAEVDIYMNAAHIWTQGAVFTVQGAVTFTSTVGTWVTLVARSSVSTFDVLIKKAGAMTLTTSSDLTQNTVYTNTTSNNWYFQFSAVMGAAAYITVTISSIVHPGATVANGEVSSCSGVIPAGATYSLSSSAGAYSSPQLIYAYL